MDGEGDGLVLTTHRRTAEGPLLRGVTIRDWLGRVRSSFVVGHEVINTSRSNLSL
jgi:hypothetical protein